MWANDKRVGNSPEDPSELLPDPSICSLEDYLEMQGAIGNRTRFEIVYRLLHGEDHSPTQFAEEMSLNASTVHYHLSKLVDVGLVEKRKRTERNDAGFHTYYRATVLAETILEHGVEELLHREWDFLEAYDSSVEREN